MRETKQKVTRINKIMKDRRENDNIKLVHIHLRGGCEGPRGHTQSPLWVRGGGAPGSVTTDADKRSPFGPYKMDKVERQIREITGNY